MNFRVVANLSNSSGKNPYPSLPIRVVHPHRHSALALLGLSPLLNNEDDLDLDCFQILL